MIRDPEGNPLNEQTCPVCGVETIGGTATRPINPAVGGFRDVLVLPRGSPPLPV